MKKLRIISAAFTLLLGVQMHAQKPETAGNAIAEAPRQQMHRVYTIGVQEFNDDHEEMADLNHIIEEEVQHMQTRSIGALIFSSYRALASSKVTTAMTDIVDWGLTSMANTLRSHRKDWQRAIEKECRFTKTLKMTEDISDFYMEPTTEGALALDGIAFRGFSCNQKIQTGKSGESVEVFNVEFQLDTTREGIRRMLQHSKFQVKLKSLTFNPYLCDIPNDSLSTDADRIKFDFKKRKDLTLRLHTVIKSSWVNEAILITEDQVLGEFVLEVKIDPEMLQDSCFTYDSNKPEDEIKARYIKLTGESFMVPRSFIGKIDGERYWGTGQYKLEMTLSESCRINQEAYKDRKAWKEEWKIIKKREKARKKDAQAWKKAVDRITMSWQNGQWVTEFVTPCTNILLQEGTSLINESMNVTTQVHTQSAPSRKP